MQGRSNWASHWEELTVADNRKGIHRVEVESCLSSIVVLCKKLP